MPSRRLDVQPGRYAVVRGPLPDAPRGNGSGGDGETLRADLSIAGERSSVLPEDQVPPGVPAEAGWRWLQVRGPLAFDEVGILASIATALAAAAVPIFVISTYDTDHILVPEPHLPAAGEALRAAGWEVGP